MGREALIATDDRVTSRSVKRGAAGYGALNGVLCHHVLMFAFGSRNPEEEGRPVNKPWHGTLGHGPLQVPQMA